ncbi:MAG: translesion DNA synthesis-associated protein ImuA [Betaproteobacteria bacterium]|nr:translesion DNA synthesis-associated protein ImuA [Betaproteobacteria bacterium]
MDAALRKVLENPAVWRGADLPPPACPALASGFPQLDADLPGGGWPVGALTEILCDADGIGELSLLMPGLARLWAEGRSVAWINPPWLPYAPALAVAGVAPEGCLVVQSADPAAALWATEQALRSGACGAVLAWLDGGAAPPDWRTLRRLQLAAETGGGSGFLFRPVAVGGQPSPAALRLALDVADGRLDVRLVKRRGAAGHGSRGLDISPARWRRLRAQPRDLPPGGKTLSVASVSSPVTITPVSTAVATHCTPDPAPSPAHSLAQAPAR